MIPKISFIDAMFDDIDDSSIVRSIYCQLQASTEEVSLPDQGLFGLQNESVPQQDAPNLLNSIETELSTSGLACKTTLYMPSKFCSDWILLSSDLEPTPIKPDFQHQERDIATFQDRGGSTSHHVWANNKNKRSKTKHERKRKRNQPTFRGYQQQQFHKKFEALLRFKEAFGHCLVPHTYKADQSLSRWVKRQRYQYKVMLQQDRKGESTMTQERIAMLDSIGFVWDSHELAWQDRLKELEDYERTWKLRCPCKLRQESSSSYLGQMSAQAPQAPAKWGHITQHVIRSDCVTGSVGIQLGGKEQ